MQKSLFECTIQEKLYMRLGIEFGEFKGRVAIVRRALYGTKSAAASWRATISKVIEGLGFTMCTADNDVWMRKGTNSAGEKVWEYVLVYSDDLLAVARDPGEIMAKIDQHFKLKDGSVKEPTSYLGADAGKYLLPDGTSAWYLGSDTYVKNAIKNGGGLVAQEKSWNPQAPWIEDQDSVSLFKRMEARD